MVPIDTHLKQDTRLDPECLKRYYRNVLTLFLTTRYQRLGDTQNLIQCTLLEVAMEKVKRLNLVRVLLPVRNLKCPKTAQIYVPKKGHPQETSQTGFLKTHPPEISC